LVVLAVLAGLIERGAASRMLRPYIGLLLISGVIAGMGLLLGFLSSDVQGIFFHGRQSAGGIGRCGAVRALDHRHR